MDASPEQQYWQVRNDWYNDDFQAFFNKTIAEAPHSGPVVLFGNWVQTILMSGWPIAAVRNPDSGLILNECFGRMQPLSFRPKSTDRLSVRRRSSLLRPAAIRQPSMFFSAGYIYTPSRRRGRKIYDAFVFSYVFPGRIATVSGRKCVYLLNVPQLSCSVNCCTSTIEYPVSNSRLVASCLRS